MSFALLTQRPDGIKSSQDLIASIDDAFQVGFGRLGAEHVRALDSLQKSFSGTPLGTRVAEAVSALRRSEFLDKHFVAIAAARTALQGAIHDALMAQAATVLKRTFPSEPPAVETEVQATASHHEVYLESARQWLMEIALAGFFQLTNDAVIPFLATLDKLQADVALLRPAAVLTGLVNELLEAMPLAGRTDIPAQRWVDLWSRAMVLATRLPAPSKSEAVSGTLTLLGAEVRENDNMASAVFHGVLVNGEQGRHVRASVTVYKVDVVLGAEMWRLFHAQASTLCSAFVDGKSIELKQMKLLSTGDLVWEDSKAKLGGAADLLATATRWMTPGSPLASMALGGVDRHPAQIAIPLLLSDFSKFEGTDDQLTILFADNSKLPIAHQRMAAQIDFELSDLRGARCIVGLLRYDGEEWGYHPLGLIQRGPKANKVLMSGAFAAQKGAGKEGREAALPILKERASKLLRAKS